VMTPKDIGGLMQAARVKELAGCSDSACLTELGNALGADAIVLGDVAQVGKKIQVTVRVLSTADAKVLASFSERVDDREGLMDALARGAKKMAGELGEAAPPKKAAAAAAPCDGDWCEVDHFERRSSEEMGVDLNAVWAGSPSSAWTVGYLSTAAYFDGAKWKARNAPSLGGGILRSIWATGPDFAVVGGQNGESARWKKTGWKPHPKLGNYADFRAIDGLPDGGTVLAATDKGVYALDGDGFRQQTDAGVWGVAVASATDAWAVGEKGYVARFDGKAWKTVDAKAEKKRLWAVSASGPNDVWAAGDDGTVLHFDGKAWTRSRPSDSDWAWVSAAGPKDVWICGSNGGLMHFDGEDWSSVSTPRASTVRSCHGAGPNDVFFVQDVSGSGSRAYHFHR
jgi:hypothetical protein